MARPRARGGLWGGWPIAGALALGFSLPGVAQPGDPPRTALSGVVELARLVDLSAERIGLRIEYDAKTLQGATVTLRLGAAVTDGELWALTNQLLAARGFTSVQMPGHDVLSIVKLPEAAGAARIEPGERPDSLAGYVSVLVPVRHQPGKDLVEAAKLLVSKPGGAVTALGEDRILISDLRPRVSEVLGFIEQIDVPGEQVVVLQIPAKFVGSAQLAASVNATVTVRNTLTDLPLRGKLTAVPEGDSVVLVAPQGELTEWIELVGQFDQREVVETRSYVPRYFSIGEVGGLLEQTARDQSPRGAGDQWRVVSDELTGTLIVTATASEHERVAALIERLNSVPVEARRPVRSYRIKNRSVNEIVEILQKLIEAGVLEEGAPEGAAAQAQSAALQRTDRDVLPPGGSVSVLSTAPAPPPTPPAPAPALGPAVSRQNGSASGQPGARQVGTPEITLTADEGTNTLIAIGDARRLDQLGSLIRELDVRQTQVMIEVLVLSLSDGDTFDLGVELESISISGSTLFNLASLFGLGTPGVGPGTPEGAGGTALILSPGDYRVLIRALETMNQGRSLNIPKVLVNNNQEATVDSVLQQPFLATNASNTVATTSFGGTQDAGTTVTVTPQIAEGDHLVLEYTVSLSTFVGESTDPALPPPRQQNNVNSTVTIPDGYTVVVGGLEVTTEGEAVSQVPLLGNIPLFGELFKSRSNTRTRSRFYVFIRTSILRNEGFEDLKYISDVDVQAAGLDDGWPVVEPRIMR